MSKGTLLRGLRVCARQLTGDPAFSLLPLMMIGIGMGANTIVLSTVDSWLLKPLPFRDPQQLAAIWESESKNPSLPSIFAPWRHFQEWERQSTSFDSLAGFFWRGYTLTGLGETDS